MMEAESCLGHRGRQAAQVATALACLATAMVPAGRAGAADQYLKGKIIISAEPMARLDGHEGTCHGYAEYRITVINRDQKEHVVGLWVPGDSYNPNTLRIRSVSRTVRVGPGSPVVVTLLQPPLPMPGDGLGVSIDRRPQRNASCDDPRHFTDYWSPNKVAAVLAGRNVPEAIRNEIGRMNVGGNSVSVFRSETPVTRWSGNWLAYSRYEGLVVTASEMQQVPPAALAAITRYVECGGSLLVLGSGWEAPAAWQPRRLDLRGHTAYYLGFGECRIWRQARGGWASIAQRMWEAGHQPWSYPGRDTEEANQLFPVIEDLQVPVRGLFVLMLVFAAVIGPVNLIVLAKKRRRIWMLWTVPAISLLTCGAVFAYATVAEGLEGHRRTETLTILDQQTHRAATIGWTAFYSPLTPGEGLRFEYDTELTPQVEIGYGVSGSSRTVDWSHDQHLASGWISARVPAHFMVRKNQTRRERIVLRRTAGGLAAVNGLGARIARLYLADDKGRVYQASNIAPGAVAALSPKPGARPVQGPTTRSSSGVSKAAALRKAYAATDWTGGTAKLLRSPQTYPQPRTYIAALDETRFVEEGLRGAQPRKCRAVVYGFLGPAEAGGS